MTDLLRGDSTYDASVVVPVRNRPDMLRECLACLGKQDYPLDKFEVIVCDDGSSDDLSGIVSEAAQFGLHVRMVKQPPRGPACARNNGILHAQSQIVVFVDSDIESTRGLVRNLVEPLLSDIDCAGVEGKLVPSGQEDNPLWHAPSSLSGGAFHTAAIAYRRDVLMAVGGFDQSFRYPLCEDAELAARVLQQGHVRFSPGAVAYHPRRPVTIGWRYFVSKGWRYAMFIGVRYGIISLPFKKTHYPRLRLAFSAIALVPVGRTRNALPWLLKRPSVGLKALGMCLLDFVFGVMALPAILLSRPPERRDYLAGGVAGEADKKCTS